MTKAYTTLKIAFLSCFIAYSVVEADVILKVTGDNVNLRAVADGESEVVSQVSRGTILHADKFTGGDWVGVSVPSGVAVWVYAELVRDNIVAVSKLSVRSGPGINYRTVGMLLKGEEVVSHGTLNGWLKISAPANCRVWISSKYVELVDSTVKEIALKPVEKIVVKPAVKTPPEARLRFATTRQVGFANPVVAPPVAKPIMKPEAVPVKSVDVVVVQDVEPLVTDEPVVQPIEDFTLAAPKKVVESVSMPEAKHIVKPLKPMKPIVVEAEIVTIKEPEIEQPAVKKIIEPQIELVEVAKPVIAISEPILIEAKPMSQPVVEVVEPQKEEIDESVTELVSMLAADELDTDSDVPVVELVSEVASDPITAADNVIVSSISEVIPTPEIVVLPIIAEEVRSIEPDAALVCVVEDAVVAEPATVAVESPEVRVVEPVIVDPVEVELVAEQVVTGPVKVSAIEPAGLLCVELNDSEVVEVDKYESIDTNNIPEDIELDSLVLSMSQGSEVTLTGKLKRAGRILRRRPSRYRLMGDTANCYVISENDNLEKLLGAVVTLTGRAYWVQGVRDMVISIDDIKMIPSAPALP